jgi:hypothetical protein
MNGLETYLWAFAEQPPEVVEGVEARIRAEEARSMAKRAEGLSGQVEEDQEARLTLLARAVLAAQSHPKAEAGAEIQSWVRVVERKPLPLQKRRAQRGAEGKLEIAS